MRFTGEVVRVIIDRWAEEMEASLLRSKVEVFLLDKYIAYVGIATQIILPGLEWKETGEG